MHRQLQLSVQALVHCKEKVQALLVHCEGKKRERAGMMFMTGRASTTLTAQCTVHCTGRWLAEA